MASVMLARFFCFSLGLRWLPWVQKDCGYFPKGPSLWETIFGECWGVEAPQFLDFLIFLEFANSRRDCRNYWLCPSGIPDTDMMKGRTFEGSLFLSVSTRSEDMSLFKGSPGTREGLRSWQNLTKWIIYIYILIHISGRKITTSNFYVFMILHGQVWQGIEM